MQENTTRSDQNDQVAHIRIVRSMQFKDSVNGLTYEAYYWQWLRLTNDHEPFTAA